MGRPLRIQYPGALYHITSRGNERKAIFHEDADRMKLLRILEDYHERYGILLHGYVLMDNHYHLILETPLGNLVKVMHGVNSAYTGYFNRKYERSGHLFQGRYQAILVEKEAYLLGLSRYIHLNPVRAGLVKNPAAYPWSSCPGFFRRQEEVRWVEYAWILSRFDSSPARARSMYRKFVMAGQNDEIAPLQDLYGQVILGSAPFVARMLALVKDTPLDEEIVERKRLQSYPSPESILKAVARVFDVPLESLRSPGGRGNQPRKVALYLVRRYCGMSNREVGAFFGKMGYAAVSKTISRLEQELSEKDGLRRSVEEIMSNVKA